MRCRDRAVFPAPSPWPQAPSRWARQRTFRKAPGGTVSAAHVAAPAAAIVDVDRTISRQAQHAPGFTSAWETASPNESFGVQRLMAWHRQIPFGISRLAPGTRSATDVDPCPTDSPGKRKRRFRICPLRPIIRSSNATRL